MTAQNSPVQTTIAARVAERLRTEISQGALPAGSPLRQNEIAARLGVSSTPVREAFHMLERQGLVSREGRRGVRVYRPSMIDLENAYEVRGALEVLAARLAAARRSDVELASITATMERMHAPGVSQDDFLRLNASFHAEIAQCSGNARLSELIAAEQASTTSFLVFLGVDETSAREAEGEHRAILSAIAAHDVDSAAKGMSMHLAARLDALRTRLDPADLRETDQQAAVPAS